MSPSKQNELHQLILNELQELRTEVKEIRQSDIPGLKTEVAGFHERIKTLDRQQTWAMRLYTVVGGAIAVLVSKYSGH